MSWLDDFDPQTVAQQLAQASIYAQQAQLQSQKNNIVTQQKALAALKTALTDFRSALQGLSSSGSSGGMVKNNATASQEGYVTLKATSEAKKGLYNIHVKQTASADQKVFEELTDDDVNAVTGNLKITIAGKDVDIDISSVKNLAELRDRINAESGDVGVTASLVRQNGKNVLMVSSDNTGAENAVTLSSSDADFEASLAKAKQISQARDAIITMGDGDAMTFTNSSNTFKDTIPGVELTVIRPTADTDPLVINVDNDEAGTKEQAQAFVDAWNKLRTQLDDLTKSGNGDGTVTRGALAGDATLTALENKLDGLLRISVDGVKLSDFGITADKSGQLKLDGKKFEEALKASPDALNTLFEGNSGLLKRMEKEGLDSFLSGTNGTLKQRQETLDRKTAQLNVKESQIQARYETAFDRYVKQFTNMKSIINQMNQTMGQFF